MHGMSPDPSFKPELKSKHVFLVQLHYMIMTKCQPATFRKKSSKTFPLWQSGSQQTLPKRALFYYFSQCILLWKIYLPWNAAVDYTLITVIKHLDECHRNK